MTGQGVVRLSVHRVAFGVDDVNDDMRELAERFAHQAETTAGAEREIMDAMEEGES